MGRCFGRKHSTAHPRSSAIRRRPSIFKAASSQMPNPGRNPFWLFLAQYRKNNKDANCHMSARQVSIMAGSMWKGMTKEEKAPFIEAARLVNYVFKFKNCPNGNLVLEKLRSSVADGVYHPETFWVLIELVQYWRNCVLRGLNPRKQRSLN